MVVKMADHLHKKNGIPKEDVERLSSTLKPEPCDLECGDRFFKGRPRCRHGRTPEQSLVNL